MSVNVKLYCGDNRVSLRRLIDEGVRVHSVVTDPPYGLVSVQKRFGAEGAAPARVEGNDGSFARLSGGFMGKVWDGTGIERDPEFWRLIWEILLPGGYVFAFSGSRTGHWQACAMEQAGFIMHPMHGWVTGQGFPKAQAADKAIDKMLGKDVSDSKFAGAIDRRESGPSGNKKCDNCGKWLVSSNPCACPRPQDRPKTPEAAQWEGWAYGTQAQKPALEPIYLGQKPFSEKTGAANLLKHGVGAVNIDATRVPLNGSATYGCSARSSLPDSKVCTCPSHEANQTPRIENRSTQVSSSLEPDDLDDLLSSVEPRARQEEAVQGSRSDCQTYRHCDDEPAREEEDRAQDASTSQGDASILPSRCAKCGCIRENLSKPYLEYTAQHVENKGRHPSNLILDGSPEVVAMFPNDSARFFHQFPPDTDPVIYQPKAGKEDRAGSKHPTVKPVALMQYLIRHITPPGGTVLDPFAGSGTTAEAAKREGFDCILMEAEDEYIEFLRHRFTGDFFCNVEVHDASRGA